jgi:phosphoglycolate phosphatase-like HAD superfamily hydrolase
MQLLALDFDGVISDSATESFLVALQTYTRLRGDSRFVGLASDLRGADREIVRANPVYQDFLALLPLGNRAEDFAVALCLLEDGRRVEDQDAYDLEKNSQPEDFMNDYHGEFYVERERLSEMGEAAWLALLGPYPAFIEWLHARAGDVVLAVATAKDRRSVDRLLTAYGIDGLFPSERILDKEAGPDKQAHLRALAARTDVAFEEMTFIDDKVNHLDSVSQLGVRCGLAAWGYNGSRERALAEARGHLVLELSDLDNQLFPDR